MNTNENTVRLLEEELDLLQRAKIAILRSRLNAGLLMIPEGLEVWNSETEEEPSIEEEIFEALTKPLRDIDSCTSFLPLIIRGPKDLLDSIRHLKFSDDRSVEVLEDRIAVIEDRLAKYRASMVE